MKFKPGDKVSFLNEKRNGVVVNILSDFRVLIMTDEGFEVPVAAEEIVLMEGKAKYKMDKPIDPKWIEEKEEQPSIGPVPPGTAAPAATPDPAPDTTAQVQKLTPGQTPPAAPTPQAAPANPPAGQSKQPAPAVPPASGSTKRP